MLEGYGAELTQWGGGDVYFRLIVSHDHHYLAEMPAQANAESFSLCCHSDEHRLCVSNFRGLMWYHGNHNHYHECFLDGFYVHT